MRSARKGDSLTRSLPPSLLIPAPTPLLHCHQPGRDSQLPRACLSVPCVWARNVWHVPCGRARGDPQGSGLCGQQEARVQPGALGSSLLFLSARPGA